MARPARSLVSVGLGLALASQALAGTASAKTHQWKFKEIFSNADGSVQYIEMEVIDPSGTDEWGVFGNRIETRDEIYFIPSNLPNENTYLRSMLFATPAFAALPGAPTPDFIIPAGFFDPLGDELRYRIIHDTLAFDAGELPTDGQRALARSDRSTPLNTPENFAGETATIDASSNVVSGLWPPLIVVVVCSTALLTTRLRRGAHPTER